MDKVSVIIPTYNNPTELKKAVESVFRQSYTNIEIIIINDGSDVSYADTIEALKAESKVPLIYQRQTNTGPGLARQKGLEIASGSFFQYLDSDDELLPEKIEYQVRILEKNPSAVMTYGLSCIKWDANKIHRYKHEKKHEDNLLISTLEKRKWHTSACLWRYPKGVYWEGLYNGEDVLHDFNVGLNIGTEIIFTNKVLSNINFEQNESHLSNAYDDKSKLKRLVQNSIHLNERMLKGLKERSLEMDSLFAEPLSERFLYKGMVFSKIGFQIEGLKMLRNAHLLTNSQFKKLEIILAILITRYFNDKYRPILLRQLFLIHRRLQPPKVHQYRYV